MIAATVGDGPGSRLTSTQVKNTVLRQRADPRAFAGVSIEDGPCVEACLVGYDVQQTIVTVRRAMPSKSLRLSRRFSFWLKDEICAFAVA